jgi:hypothetical protein
VFSAGTPSIIDKNCATWPKLLRFGPGGRRGIVRYVDGVLRELAPVILITQLRGREPRYLWSARDSGKHGAPDLIDSGRFGDELNHEHQGSRGGPIIASGIARQLVNRAIEVGPGDLHLLPAAAGTVRPLHASIIGPETKLRDELRVAPQQT